MKRLILYIIGLIFLAGCSTTKHLPEGEILYIGQKPMIVENRYGGSGSCVGYSTEQRFTG